MFYRILRTFVPAVAAAATGLLMLSGAAFAQTAPTPSSQPQQAPLCGWGHRIWGVPQTFHAGSADGYYVWCGPSESGARDRELHLRTTDSVGVHQYSGILRSDGVFTDVEKVRDEADDHVDVLDGGHEIKFSFVTYRGIDGFNFNVKGGSRVHLSLDEHGKRISASSIYLGEDSVHPKHNPFRIHRLHEREHHGHHMKRSTSTTSTTSATSTATSPAS